MLDTSSTIRAARRIRYYSPLPVHQKYRIQTVVSDWRRGIISALASYYPKAIHQRCAAHVLREVLVKIGGPMFIRSEEGKKLWKKIRKIGIEHERLSYARSHLTRLKKKYPSYHRAFERLDKTLSDLYQFTKNSSLQTPRTSNRIENFMSVLEQRLKTFRGMKTPETLIRIITSIIIFKWKNQPKN